MAVFRIERTRDYTVMSNHHLRNANLSLKAKGLLSMMLSLPEDWNYTTRGLAKICKEGVDAIGAALRELEGAGYIMIERIKQNKSLVDIKLTARACQEHYQKQVDSFVIVSSDSDYWGLISSLPDARFLVMIEREKCGPDMTAALAESGIFYCYLDDFYSGNSEDIKKNALFKEMYRWIDNSVHLNVNDMFDAALRNTRIEMSPAERRQFYEKHIKHMTLTIDENGNVSIELKRG